MRLSAEILELDLYGILGISPSATEGEIRRAHRRQARASHPDLDRSGRDHQKAMVDINVAAWVLCDPDLRRHYDRRRRSKDASGGGVPWYQRPTSGSESWFIPERPKRQKPPTQEIAGILRRLRDWPARVFLTLDETENRLTTLERTALTAACMLTAILLIAWAKPTSLTKLFEDEQTTAEAQN